MGLLDSIVGVVTQGGGVPGGAGGNTVLVQVIGKLLLAEGGNGLESLVQRLTQGGLGDVVQSWVGTGANLPVSGEQLHSALGSDAIGAMAQQAGMSTGDFGDRLAQLLPRAVDRLTPAGQLPQAGGDLGGMLSSLLSGLDDKT